MVEMRRGTVGELIRFRSAEYLGLSSYTCRDIAEGKSKQINIKYAIDVLSGCGEPAREDIVCVNAANLLHVAGIAEDLREGYFKAKLTVRKRHALEKLEEFIELTGGDKNLLKKHIG